MTSYNDLSVHELLDICYSIVIGQSLDNRALLAVSNARLTHYLSKELFTKFKSAISQRVNVQRTARVFI